MHYFWDHSNIIKRAVLNKYEGEDDWTKQTYITNYIQYNMTFAAGIESNGPMKIFA